MDNDKYEVGLQRMRELMGDRADLVVEKLKKFHQILLDTPLSFLMVKLEIEKYSVTKNEKWLLWLA